MNWARARMRGERTLLCGLVVLALAWPGAPSRARAGALFSLDEALALAFPEADRVVKRHVFLAGEDLQRAEKLAQAKIESKLWTFYAGHRDGKLTGYAALDTRVVRTLPETVMVVLDPDGRIRSVRMLAFYEPSEYRPPKRWLHQFDGANLEADMRPGSGIQGITGATLSARSLSGSVRRVLAVFRVGVKER